MRAILDSGPLVALWRARDQNKSWAERIFQEYTGPFYVSEAVLTEVSHLTGMDGEITEGLRRGRLIIGATLAEDLEAIQRCLSAYPHCDLADASVVAASERRVSLNVLTTDRRHFSTYRRKDGSPLPIVLPTAR
jgi:predicted nucleic acid-binding protein